uniref:Uncharacterized protein n=1 Tax=Arundo donax TaxID=35708 RepID=A0A0A8YIU1_ARUDO
MLSIRAISSSFGLWPRVYASIVPIM